MPPQHWLHASNPEQPYQAGESQRRNTRRHQRSRNTPAEYPTPERVVAEDNELCYDDHQSPSDGIHKLSKYNCKDKSTIMNQCRFTAQELVLETEATAEWKMRAIQGFIAHAGPLLTLVDHAMSTVAWEAAGRVPCVTLQLDSHFAAPVLAGQFVEARAQVARRTGSLIFMRGDLRVSDSLVLSAQALMKPLKGNT
jgi:acyl-coenzyme A thioesterase PaaI-like protein